MKIIECGVTAANFCNETNNIIDVAKKLKESSSRHLVVVDNASTPVGVISSVDIVNKVVAENKNPKNLHAKDIMTTDLFIADINDDAIKIYYGMVGKNILFCPVVENKALKGIITMHSIIKHVTLSNAQKKIAKPSVKKKSKQKGSAKNGPRRRS